MPCPLSVIDYTLNRRRTRGIGRTTCTMPPNGWLTSFTPSGTRITRLFAIRPDKTIAQPRAELNRVMLNHQLFGQVAARLESCCFQI